MSGRLGVDTRGGRRARSVAVRLLAVLCLGVLGLTASQGLAAPAGEQVSISAGSADVTGLAYEGPATVGTPAGDVTVLRLVAQTAQLTGFRMRTAGGSHALVTTAAGTTRASGLVLLATEVDATVDGTAVSWTPDAPPPAEPLPNGSGTLSDLVVHGVVVTAETLRVPGARQSVE